MMLEAIVVIVGVLAVTAALLVPLFLTSRRKWTAVRPPLKPTLAKSDLPDEFFDDCLYTGSASNDLKAVYLLMYAHRADADKFIQRHKDTRYVKVFARKNDDIVLYYDSLTINKKDKQND